MQLRARFLSVIVTLATVVLFSVNPNIHGQSPSLALGSYEVAEIIEPADGYLHARAYARVEIDGVTYTAMSFAGSRSLRDQFPGYAVDGQATAFSPSDFPDTFVFGMTMGVSIYEFEGEQIPLFYGSWLGTDSLHSFIYDHRRDRLVNDILFEGGAVASSFAKGTGAMTDNRLYGNHNVPTVSQPIIEATYNPTTGEVATRNYTEVAGLTTEGFGYRVEGVNQAGDVVAVRTSEGASGWSVLLINHTGEVDFISDPDGVEMPNVEATAPNDGRDFAISAVFDSQTDIASYICQEELLSTGNPFLSVAQGGAEVEVRAVDNDRTVMMKSGLWRQGVGFVNFSDLVSDLCERDTSLDCLTGMVDASQLRNGVVVGYGTIRVMGNPVPALLERGVVLRPVPSPEVRFTGGDTNNDGSTDLSDAVRIFVFLFTDGAQLTCEASADINGDDSLDISDGIALLTALFLGGQVPNPACSGTVPDGASLTCESAPACES